MAGVIGHIRNPEAGAAVELAQAAERAGADWIGLADAFWWRDVWMLLVDVAAATERIEIGPAMTNPYLRHPFHTAAALATLQERAADRVFCGVAAGGSELVAAGLSRQDAPERLRALVALLQRVSAGGPLDAASGRTLEVRLDDVPVLVAARGDAMLRAAGECADRVLLWAVPNSDLERSVDLVLSGAAARDEPPELIWAPLVRLPAAPESALLQVAVYASINTASAVRQRWGLGPDEVAAIRTTLVAGGTDAAAELVPAAALDDLILTEAEPDDVAARARSLGIGRMAVPGFSAGTVPAHVEWAAAVEREIPGSAGSTR